MRHNELAGKKCDVALLTHERLQGAIDAVCTGQKARFRGLRVLPLVRQFLDLAEALLDPGVP